MQPSSPSRNTLGLNCISLTQNVAIDSMTVGPYASEALPSDSGLPAGIGAGKRTENALNALTFRVSFVSLRRLVANYFTSSATS